MTLQQTIHKHSTNTNPHKQTSMDAQKSRQPKHAACATIVIPEKTPTKPSARKAEENIFQLAYHLPTMQQREIKTDLYIKQMHQIGTTDTDILQKTQARTVTHTQTNSSTSDHT